MKIISPCVMMASMEVTRAACIWITPDDNTREVFEATLAAYKKAYETYAQTSIENKTTSRFKLHKLAYEKTRTNVPNLPAALNQAARDWAVADIKAYNTMHPKQQFMKTPSTGRMRSMAYSLRSLSLRGNLLTLSTVGKRQRFMILIPLFFQERWLKPAVSWKLNAATLTITKKKKIKISLSFRIQLFDTPRIEGEVLGVDRGLYNIVATSDGELYKGNRIRATRRKYAHARKTCQKKGTRSAKRRLEAISGREERFRNDMNHCISKELANRPGISVIVLEDLSSIRSLSRKEKNGKKSRTWLSGWAYRDLETKIVYKCQTTGRTVVWVDPSYTSQTCSHCGHVDKESREKGLFRCTKCGHEEQADINAAKVIRDRYITAPQEARQAAVNRPVKFR